jgi:hypothetical protein
VFRSFLTCCCVQGARDTGTPTSRCARPRGPVQFDRRCNCGIELTAAMPVVIGAQLLHRDRREPHDTPGFVTPAPGPHKTIQRCGPDSGTGRWLSSGRSTSLPSTTVAPAAPTSTRMQF